VGKLSTFEEELLRKKYPKGNLPFLVNEYGLYEILFQSTKPIAKKFKYHVFLLFKDIRLGNIKLLQTENSLLKNHLETVKQ
jgi:prophage antirepressor-like protein